MPFTGPGPGRPKGSVNKNPAEIKEMILKALDSKGGWRYLAKQADANPVAFLGLLGKIMPLQVSGSGNVLLIEQLCVVANNEWQKERAKLTAPVIDTQAESVEIAADPVSDESVKATTEDRREWWLRDGEQKGRHDAAELVTAAETLEKRRTPSPPPSRRKRPAGRKRKPSPSSETREELLARMARLRAARRPLETEAGGAQRRGAKRG